MVFHQMDTEEVSDRFIAPYFVNGLEAYDGEINLGVEENMISNKYAVKLCLEHEVKRGKKVVKKELIVALRGEIYFVKLIINPKEDDVKPGVILRRTFLCMTKAINDFEAGTVTIYPEFDLFLEDIREEEKRTSSSAGGHLTQKEAAKEALAIRISQKFALLEEARPEEAIKRIKGEALKEKGDPRAFKFSIRLERKVNENALADTGSNINTMPYRIYETLGREKMKKIGVTIIIAKFLILDIPIDHDAPIVVGRGFLYTIDSILNTPENFFSTFDGICHQTFRAARFDVLITTESDNDDEEEYQIKRNKFGAPIYGPKPVPYLNCNDPARRSLALQARHPTFLANLWSLAATTTPPPPHRSTSTSSSSHHATTIHSRHHHLISIIISSSPSYLTHHHRHPPHHHATTTYSPTATTTSSPPPPSPATNKGAFGLDIV
nr:hypothetical protein [Tanacetum cinerariifolium]